MSSSSRSNTPRPSAPRSSTVASFYAFLAVVAFFWHAIVEDSNDVWRAGPEISWATLLWTPLIGVAFGLAVVVAFRWLEPRQPWISELGGEFRSIFGRPRLRELFLLAAASSLGEELLFRGAMLDAWGVWLSSLVFAALHLPPRRTLWPWTLSSFILGVALGLLTLLTHNLGAAVAAHFVINLLNLHYITRGEEASASRVEVRVGLLRV